MVRFIMFLVSQTDFANHRASCVVVPDLSCYRLFLVSQTSSVTEWQRFQTEDVMVSAVMLQVVPRVSDRLHQPQSCVVVRD